MIQINQKFAAKYEHNNARNEQERLEAKYGKNPIEDEESYDSETEDDEDVQNEEICSHDA